MAIPNFLFRNSAEEEDSIEKGYIDPIQLQKLQDSFCSANGVYLACVGKREGVITKAYGTKEVKEYIYSIVSKSRYMSLLRKMETSTVENVIEEPLDVDYVKLCGVTTAVAEDDKVIWIVVAVIEERVPEDVVLPEGIYSTTETRFFSAIELLEALTKQLILTKRSEISARAAMESSFESENNMEIQLKRAQSMTEIVKLLESSEGFNKIVDAALKGACITLDICGGCLIRENADGKTLDMLCEYAGPGYSSLMDKCRHVSKEKIPFFTGKPYMISSDSIIPPAFEKIMETNNVSAAIFQPVEANDRVLMYLCFYEYDRERKWSVADIEFLNDVKRIVQSILGKRITSNSLASSYASLEAILEHVGCGIYVADMERRKILYMNEIYRCLYQNTSDEDAIEDMIFHEDLLMAAQSFEEKYSEKEDKWFDIHKTVINWVDGREVTLCTTYDITDKKKYQRKIEQQANNDFLTGLFNRMKCEHDLEKYIHRAELTGKDGALIYIDLDDFKHINDGLGHQYGDVLLKSISHNLLRIPGIENTCYRMGGDEFIVIVAEADRQTLEGVCNNIREIFAKPWFLKGEDYYCTTSIGVSMFPSDANTVDDVIRKADMALYSAKRKGKNRLEFFSATDDGSSAKRLDLEKNMRNATMNEMREFEIYYQPIVDISGEQEVCRGAEALVRWNSEALGFIAPDDFIPLAEYLGLINPIGDYVLLNAAKRCKYWNDMGHPSYKINVNLSVVQLLQNDIVKRIRNVLEETRVNPKNLCLEVTEGLAINDMERMKRILGEIKELGVDVALDDFGTGYSSLNHIREMPIDVIKIDKCFIENIATDDFSDAFVKMIAELAKTIGVTVCVEGVEKKAQYDIVKKTGIKYIQGFFYGKPMKVAEFEELYL